MATKLDLKFFQNVVEAFSFLWLAKSESQAVEETIIFPSVTHFHHSSVAASKIEIYRQTVVVTAPASVRE